MPSKLRDKQKWYAAGLHFECAQCGNCCGGFPGYVWVTEEEARAAAKFLNLSVDQFGIKYLRRILRRYSLVEVANYDCVFLQRTPEGIRCRIYPVRPQQCRTWPLWKMNLSSSDDFLARTQRCPGINRGRGYSREEIEEILKQSPC